MPNGVKLTEELAKRTKRVVESYEQQRGSFSKVARQMPTPRRQARYYVTPAAGIPAPPAGEHTVSSADCMLLKFDATQSAFVPVRDEKVYSLQAFPGEMLVRVEQINGRPFVVSQPADITIQAPAGGIPAANNYDFGSADCTVMVNDGGTWKNSGSTVQVYNPSTEAQPTEGLRLGWAVWDGSQYIFVSVLCDDTRTFVAPEAL